MRAPSSKDQRRWRRYLADERAEAAVYRDLAGRRSGEDRAILLALAEAEGRHEAHWLELLGDDVGQPRRSDLRTLAVGFLARRFGSVFVLALVQRAESRSAYALDADATAEMAADEQIHEEVVRGLATGGRNRMSGTFRAAVFGANDGLVSNLALVAGIGASGAAHSTLLLTGFAGLLAGAMSMAAGEYVSVRSQLELLQASTPNPLTQNALPHLNAARNELDLVYRARGMGAEEAAAHARKVRDSAIAGVTTPEEQVNGHETIGTAKGAAASSFCFFASGAMIPVLPYVFGLDGLAAIMVASFLVGIALLCTGATVGVLSGGSPVRPALRQLGIGFGAAAVTYVLGLAFGATLG